MNIFDFILTVIISVLSGLFIGYFLQKIITNLLHFYQRHLKKSHFFIEISPHLTASIKKQNADDKANKK